MFRCCFDVGRFGDDDEEASLKMPSRLTAATEAGARGLAERASLRPIIKAFWIVHVLHAPAPVHQRLQLGATSAQRQPMQRLAPVRA